jgi:hypothetical protein
MTSGSSSRPYSSSFQYAKALRKAGIAWRKGDVDKAITILAAGLELA